MPLDEPVPHPPDRKQAEVALKRTHDWFARSVKAHQRKDTALFSIVQGSLYHDLREQSVKALLEHDPPGMAVGGLSVGEKNDECHEVAAFTASLIPEDKPRYLMGVGTPQDLERAVRAGYDMFDCILPTRVARTGWAYTAEGILRLRNRKFTSDDRPIEADCDCPACINFSRAYIRHCMNVDEILGITLLSMHNVRMYMRTMQRIRTAIEEGTFVRS